MFRTTRLSTFIPRSAQIKLELAETDQRQDEKDGIRRNWAKTIVFRSFDRAPRVERFAWNRLTGLIAARGEGGIKTGNESDKKNEAGQAAGQGAEAHFRQDDIPSR